MQTSRGGGTLPVSGDPPFRVLPALADENSFFWTSGADGELRFLRCRWCGYCLHPPSPRCPPCRSRSWRPTRSRRGRRCTVHRQPPAVGRHLDAVRDRHRRARPSRPALRLTTNIVGCEPDDGAHRHAGAGRVRGRTTACGCRSSSRSDGCDGMTDDRRATRGHLRRRPVRRSAGGSTATRSTSRIEACARAPSTTPGSPVADIDGLATYPGDMDGAARASPAPASPRCRTRCAWSSTGSPAARGARPARGGGQRGDGGRRRAGRPRARATARSWEASAQGDRRPGIGLDGRRRWRRRYRAIGGFMQWTLPFGASSAANWLGDDGAAPLPRVRHHPRAAGPDRAQRPAQRRAQPARRSTASR